MISRRSIRIKVMQALYMKEKDAAVAAPQVHAYAVKSLDNFYRLYLLNLYLLVETANRVNELAQTRASKLLRTEQDLNVSVRLFHNPVMQNIALSPAYNDGVRKEKFDIAFDNDLLKRAFQKFSETPEYNSYTALDNPLPKDDLKIIAKLYNDFIANDETLEHAVEDLFSNWPDDKQSVTQLINSTLKTVADTPEAQAVPNRTPLTEEKKFARELIDMFLFHEPEYSALIKPKLRNWDEERIAEMDMLLIKMGLTEFLHMSDIPVKVTINEYLEIAKQYSTPQSKDFINGVLDGILTDLKVNQQLHKSGRGSIN